MYNDIELTDEERSVIKSLKRIGKKWPESLVVFGAGGQLSIRKKDEEGRYGVNREVDSIHGIINDGGDGGDY